MIPHKQMTAHKQISDLIMLSVIGKGSYAKVLIVRSKIDGKVYALKIMKKQHMIEKQQINNTITQQTILAKMEHPFVVQLKASFQDQKKLYFLMEYCPGGQLFGLLSIKNKISQQQAKFYSSQVLIALERLHSYGIIYRDLKPQNILLDKQGYIKLTDFGLSKMLKDQNEVAMSVCGTPQYLAPEMILKQGHGFEVDWWCLGCLIYQMVVGYPPFHSKNHNQLFDAILQRPFNLPEVSPKLQNLFFKLLQKDPKKRLGTKGAEQLKSHPWFEKVNWQMLVSKSIKAPFVPILSSDADFSNFDEQFTTCSVESYSQYDTKMDVEINQDHFIGFGYGQ